MAYLSGDTGIITEEERVVRQHYNATLAVMNIGDVFTIGPTEAAFVINELAKPNAVIMSQANKTVTKGGKVIAGTKADLFIKATNAPVHLSLSERTIAFDGKEKCLSCCS